MFNRKPTLNPRKRFTPAQLQQRQLLMLLKKARSTAFGQYHYFDGVMASKNMVQSFHEAVPAMDYNTIYDKWWSRAHLCDDANICWPGVIPFYALSSGTSQSTTKFIPVTQDMLGSMARGSSRMMIDAMRMPNIPIQQFARKMLMVGSSTAIKREGRHYTGDLSGIIAANRPVWLNPYYLPGNSISKLPEWSQRIDAIVHAAPRWDVGFVVGNPAWVQIIFERIIDQYGLANIHQMWRHFDFFAHGGVFFEPYRSSFEAMLGRPVTTMDSYMASEGFFAYQHRPGRAGMKLMTDCGIYYEFVPFNSDNFDENGDLRSVMPDVHTLDTVKTGENYALLLSTNAGAWRYLIGDTVQFLDVEHAEICLTGRTKQYLSVCGEHLSIDNLNDAVQQANALLRAGIREFSVAALPDTENGGWIHQWWVSVSNPAVQENVLAKVLDEALCRLNDDYATERRYALKDVKLNILPVNVFYDWLNKKGKMNGQAKIPRVMKGGQLVDFQSFITENSPVLTTFNSF